MILVMLVHACAALTALTAAAWAALYVVDLVRARRRAQARLREDSQNELLPRQDCPHP